MRYFEIIENDSNKIGLTDLYDEHELYDRSEAIGVVVDEYGNDLLKEKFTVREMLPTEAKKLKSFSSESSVISSYKNASKKQKEIVAEKKNFDPSRIIVLSRNTVIDGNHHLIAALQLNQPVKYIDLEEVPLEEESKENTIIDEIQKINGNWDASFFGQKKDTRVRKYIYNASYFADVNGLTIKKSSEKQDSPIHPFITCFTFYDENALIGYAKLQKDVLDTYRITEIVLKSDYRQKGTGYAFYKLLLKRGYKLASDLIQYDGAQAIWRKLMNDPQVKVSIIEPENPRKPTVAINVERVTKQSKIWNTRKYVRLLAEKL